MDSGTLRKLEICDPHRLQDVRELVPGFEENQLDIGVPGRVSPGNSGRHDAIVALREGLRPAGGTPARPHTGRRLPQTGIPAAVPGHRRNEKRARSLRASSAPIRVRIALPPAPRKLEGRREQHQPLDLIVDDAPRRAPPGNLPGSNPSESRAVRPRPARSRASCPEIVSSSKRPSSSCGISIGTPRAANLRAKELGFAGERAGGEAVKIHDSRHFGRLRVIRANN